MEKTKGKLIVIDGVDGSGKATQTKLLADNLTSKGFRVETLNFPQYGKKSAGLIEEYLGGKYGESDEVNPFIASMFYALDRYDASFKIREYLDKGKIVILDRYVTSNMAHQGGKINNPLEKKVFFDWLLNLEYDTLKIPKPDITILLHMPSEISQKLCVNKKIVDWEGKVKDIHENNSKHLKNAEKTYLKIGDNYSDIYVIDCCKDNKILKREEIHELILNKIYSFLKMHTSIYSPDFKKLHDLKINNNKIIIKKINPNAIYPKWSKNKIGLNIFSNDYYSILPRQHANIKTDIKIILPQGYYGKIWNVNDGNLKEIMAIPDIIKPGLEVEIIISVLNLSDDIINIAPGKLISHIFLEKSIELLLEKNASFL